MKALEIVRFELAYQLTRRTTWIVFGILLFPLFGEANGQVLEAIERGIPLHAPLFVAPSAVGMGMISLLWMAAVAGDAATRDVQTRMEPLMHAAPVGRLAYLGGRFVGAFLVCALLLSVVPLALLLAPLVHSSLT